MTAEDWIAFLLVCVANNLTPGPAILNVVRRAAHLGTLRTLPLILASGLGLAVPGMACALGLAAVLLASDWLWLSVRWAGIAYLVWLGLGLVLRRAPLGAAGAGDRAASPRALVAEGLALAILNPKALPFYVAVLPQAMRPDAPALPQALILVGTYSAVALCALAAYGWLAGALRARVLTQARYDGLRRVSGLAMIGFAAALAVEGR